MNGETDVTGGRAGELEALAGARSSSPPGGTSRLAELRSSALCALALVATIAISDHYSRLYRRNVVDDAATSMQYAKNLALGHGLVFNVGERVEGYSNFLWVLFQAPLYALTHALGIHYVPALVRVSEFFAASSVGLLYLLGRRSWSHLGLLSAATLGLCTLDGSFTTWAIFGLETHFLAFWMLLTLWLLGRPSPRRWLLCGLALAATQLTRPDAGLFCALVVANELAEAWLCYRDARDAPPLERARAFKSMLREAAAMGGVWLAFAAAHLAFRRAYYGDYFPNTYYLKLAGEIDAWARGLDYLKGFLEMRLWLPLGGALALLAARDRIVRLLLVYLTAHAAYVVYVGGDFFSGHRFFVPEIPLFALLFGHGAHAGWRLLQTLRARRFLARVELPLPAVAGAAAAALVAALTALWSTGRAEGPLEREIYAWRDDLSKNRSLMTWLAQAAAPGDSIATCLIGHTGFFSNLRVIDICGVIDPVIAHQRVAGFGHGKPGHEKLGSPSYILSKQPTYFISGYLPLDLWHNGYYFSDAVPAEIADGIFVRDSGTGRYLPDTRISFDTLPEGWTASGDAFQHAPSFHHASGQGQLTGVVGGFVNSFSEQRNNDATGRLESSPFQLQGDELELRVAGGNDPERLRISLIVAGQRVRSATGRRSDALVRKRWDIRAFRGQSAQLELVDEARGAWGYIVVDEIVQWAAG